MRFVLILLLSQMLLFASGGCATEPADMPEESPESSATESSDSMSWKEEKALLNELKDLILAQEGKFNLYRDENGVVTAGARDEDTQVELDMERVSQLMNELEINFVYVRPEEDYFGFKEAVELKATWSQFYDEICYSSTVVPEYKSDGVGEGWVDEGDGWYMRHTPQI